MSLRISGKHMDIGDAFRTRIEARVGEAIDKYFDGGFAGHVTVAKSGSRFTADCMIHLDTGMALQATGEAQDPRRRLRRRRRTSGEAPAPLQAPAKSHSFGGANGDCSIDIAYTVVAAIAGRRRGSAGRLCARRSSPNRPWR